VEEIASKEGEDLADVLVHRKPELTPAALLGFMSAGHKAYSVRA
jgi:hypothetical protein